MQLTKHKIQHIKNNLGKYPPQKPQFVYTIAKKQSASSIFSNERLLFINLNQKTINYANIPKNQPFLNDNIPQIKGTISIIGGNFKYLKVKQKQPTIKLWEEIAVPGSKDGSDKKKENDWKFQLFNMDVLIQLIHIINFIYNNSSRSKSRVSSNQPNDKKQQKGSLSNQNKQNPNAQKDQKQKQNQKQKAKQNGNLLVPNKNNIVNNVENLRSPSSFVNSQQQSPIHKLEDFDNNQKMKYSQASKRINQQDNQQQDQNNKDKQSQVYHNKFKKLNSSMGVQDHTHMIESAKNKNKPREFKASKAGQKRQKYNEIALDLNGEKFFLSNSKRQKQKQKKVPRIKNFSRAYKDQLELQISSIQNKQDDSERQPGLYQQGSGEYSDEDQFDDEQNSEQERNEGQSPSYQQDKMKNRRMNNKKYGINQDDDDDSYFGNDQLDHPVENRKNEIRSQNYNSKNHGRNRKGKANSRDRQRQKESEHNMKKPPHNKNNGNRINMNNNSHGYSSPSHLIKKQQSIQFYQSLDESKQNKSGLKKQDKTISQKQGNSLQKKSLNPLQSELQTQKTSQVRNKNYSRKNCHIDWNRIFYQSNHSLKVYEQFVKTCQQILHQRILPYQLQNICTSNKSTVVVQQDGILFNIYKYTSHLTGIGGNKPKSPLIINFKQPSFFQSHNAQAQTARLIQLYCRVHNQLEHSKNIWESNNYTMEKLLINKLQKIHMVDKDQILLNKIGPNICCQIQYLGFLIYCQTQLYDQYYSQVNLETANEVYKLLGDIQKVIRIQLPNNSYQIYQPLVKNRVKQSRNESKQLNSQTNIKNIYSFLIRIVNPIQLIVSQSDSLLCSYINRYTMQKNLAQSPSSPYPNNLSTPSLILTSLSSRPLQSFIYSQIQNNLSKIFNTGVDPEVPGKLFSFCGSEHYELVMKYFNVEKTNFKDLYSLVNVRYYRKIILTQICADIFVKLLIYTIHYELNLLFIRHKNVSDIESSPSNNSPSNLPNQSLLLDIQELCRQLVYLWLNNLLSNNHPASQILWKYISDIAYGVFQVQLQSKEVYQSQEHNKNKSWSTLPGYITDFTMKKLGFNIYYSNKNFNSIGNNQSLNKNNQKQGAVKNQTKSRSRSNSKGKDKKQYFLNKVSERNIHQFPCTLYYANSQANILSFLRIEQPLYVNSPSNKQNNYGSDNKKNLQSINFQVKISQYRCSKFNILHSVLQYKILQQLVTKKIYTKQLAAVISGTIGHSSFIDQLKKKIDVFAILQQLSVKGGLPAYFRYLDNSIRLYLAHYIQYKNNRKYQSLKVYDSEYFPLLSDKIICGLVPHSSAQLKVYLIMIKQMLYNKNYILPQNMIFAKNSNVTLQNSPRQKYVSPHSNPTNFQNALYLFNCVVQQNIFWGGEYNPSMIEFYTLFSDYFVKINDWHQAIKYYKCAMAILIKVYGDVLIVSDRHCYLAEILKKGGKYRQSVRQLESALVNYQKQCEIIVYKQQKQQIQNRPYDKQRQKPKIKQGRICGYTGQQSKLLIYKYINTLIKRSRILLRNLTISLNESKMQKYSKNIKTISLSKQHLEETSQIVIPLLSVLNEIKQCLMASTSTFTDSQMQQNPYRNYIPYSLTLTGSDVLQPKFYSHYKSANFAHRCPLFIKSKILTSDQIVLQLTQILQIIFRTHLAIYKLTSQYTCKQFTNFINDYMMHNRILQPVSSNMSTFKRVLKLMLIHQFTVVNDIRNKNKVVEMSHQISNEEVHMFKWVVQALMDLSAASTNKIEENQAYGYIYQKYIKRNVRNEQYTASLQLGNENRNDKNRERSRSRSTSKKNQRQMFPVLMNRLSQWIRNIKKLTTQIIRHNIISVSQHKPLSFNTTSETAEFVVLLEALGIFIGYQFLLAVVQQSRQNVNGFKLQDCEYANNNGADYQYDRGNQSRDKYQNYNQGKNDQGQNIQNLKIKSSGSNSRTQSQPGKLYRTNTNPNSIANANANTSYKDEIVGEHPVNNSVRNNKKINRYNRSLENYYLDLKNLNRYEEQSSQYNL